MAKGLRVHQLPAGTNFKWMGKHFIICDTQIVDTNGIPTDDITNGFIYTQEIHGVGTERSCLGERNRFHADAFIVCPDLMEWLKK